jgi:hypothetical protein
MREEIRAFYYPDFIADQPTVAKAILLFDELHFMDRPGLSFFGSGGMLGMPSPIRDFLPNFNEAGIPVFVHNAPRDARPLEPLIAADISDFDFIKKFQLGLKSDPHFFSIHISADLAAALGGQDKALEMLTSIDLPSALADYGSPLDLVQDLTFRPFIGSSVLDIAKTLLFFAIQCSAKMNFAFSTSNPAVAGCNSNKPVMNDCLVSVGAKEGFVPFADARPYRDLLQRKCMRAVNQLDPSTSKIQAADLTLSALDEAVPADCLETLTIPFAIEFRKRYQGERKEFLEHIASLQEKLVAVQPGSDYRTRLENIVTSEIRPTIRTFRDKIRTVDEKTANAVSATAALTLICVFAGLGWVPVFTGLVNMARSALDAIADERAARRECSMSYILRLDDRC